MPSGSPVGTTRTFGARSIVGIRTVSGLISPWPIVLGRIIISASGSRAQVFQIFRFREVQVDRLYSGLQLQRRCRSLWLTCRLRSGLVGLPASNWKCPRRVRHHCAGRALAGLLPMGVSYSFTFSPPVAIPNVWLLCLGQDDLGWTPSGPQVGAG